MQWSDEGLVLSARKHGETSLIVSLLTREHGRHAGLVRGGAGRRARGVYQPGNLLAADWRARLAEHLGSYRCELLRAYSAELLTERLPLLALESAASLLDSALPERQPHDGLFAAFHALVQALDGPNWAVAYVWWEIGLLAGLGFGLDLESCAATGDTKNLIYVSPRTGRAVSAAAGEPYRERMLRLPAFLTATDSDDAPDAPLGRDDTEAGLALTGHFLEHHVFAAQDRHLPGARVRLAEALARGAATA